MIGSRAERWTNLCVALRDLDIEITALLPEVPVALRGNHEEQRRFEGACEKVVRLPGGPAFDAFATPESKVVSAHGRVLKRMLWPDPSALFALRAARWIRSNAASFDACITSCKPASDLLVGYTGFASARLRWFADYGDPWSLTFSADGAIRSSSFEIEKRLLKACSGVFVTTEPTRRVFIEHYGISSDKVHTVPAAVPALNYPAPPQKIGMRLFQAGVVYGPRASITPFFDALKAFRTESKTPVHVTWYGRIDRPTERTHAQEGSDTFLDRASLSEVEDGERRANVLVIFGNHGGTQIPAKIWRSLGSGRQILVVLADDTDALADLPELRGRAHCVPNEVSAILKALAEISARLDGPLACADTKLVPLPTWETRARTIVSVLESNTPLPGVTRTLNASALIKRRTVLGFGLADQLSKLRGPR